MSGETHNKLLMLDFLFCFQLSNKSGGLVTIHHRHGNVHEYQAIVPVAYGTRAQFQSLFNEIKGLLAMVSLKDKYKRIGYTIRGDVEFHLQYSL